MESLSCDSMYNIIIRLSVYDTNNFSLINKNNNKMKNNIKKYGYSIIVFHPQDFVERDEKGNVIGKRVNLSEVNELSYLIDSLVKERIPIVHFSTLVKYVNNNQNSTQPLMGGNNSMAQFGYFKNIRHPYTSFRRSMEIIQNMN